MKKKLSSWLIVSWVKNGILSTALQTITLFMAIPLVSVKETKTEREIESGREKDIPLMHKHIR